MLVPHLCVPCAALTYSGIHPRVSILNQKSGWASSTDAAEEEDTSPVSVHLGSVFPSCSDFFVIYISNCLLEECTLLVSSHHLVFTQPKIYFSVYPVLQIRCSLSLTPLLTGLGISDQLWPLSLPCYSHQPQLAHLLKSLCV